MLSSGEKDREIGDAVPGRGNLATSSGFIVSLSLAAAPAAAAAERSSGIRLPADPARLGVGRRLPLEANPSAAPNPTRAIVANPTRIAGPSVSRGALGERIERGRYPHETCFASLAPLRSKLHGSATSPALTPPTPAQQDDGVRRGKGCG